jgi:hypothetical protein
VLDPAVGDLFAAEHDDGNVDDPFQAAQIVLVAAIGFTDLDGKGRLIDVAADFGAELLQLG